MREDIVGNRLLPWSGNPGTDGAFSDSWHAASSVRPFPVSYRGALSRLLRPGAFYREARPLSAIHTRRRWRSSRSDSPRGSGQAGLVHLVGHLPRRSQPLSLSSWSIRTRENASGFGMDGKCEYISGRDGNSRFLSGCRTADSTGLKSRPYKSESKGGEVNSPLQGCSDAFRQAVSISKLDW
jgi:hypothetical protein